MKTTSLWIACAALIGVHQLGSTTNLGVLNATPEIQVLEILAPNVTFSTQYLFTVLNNSAVSAVASNLWLQLNNITVLGIDNFSLTLHDNSNNLLASAVSSNDSYSIDGFALTPNPYYFEVSGDTVGSQGGYYSFAAAAYDILTPMPVVPEPGSVSMLALGLAAIVVYRLRPSVKKHAKGLSA
jgi:PEP-CTERM motif